MISAVKINDQILLNYSLQKVHEDMDIDPHEYFRTKDIVNFGQFFNDEPYWVVTIYDFTTARDSKLDITLNRKGLLSVDTFERIGRICGDYIFNQNNCLRISTSIRASNKKSLRLTKAFGFKVEGVIRNGYNKPMVEDKILLGMLREECPWINGDAK